MELGGGHVAARQDEALQWLQLLVPSIHPRFQVGHVVLFDPGHGEPRLVLFRDAKVGPEVEQNLLDDEERRLHRLVQPGRDGHTDRRVQLVDGAVGLDAQAVLSHSLAAAERRRTVIAGTGVDAVDVDHAGIVPQRQPRRESSS